LPKRALHGKNKERGENAAEEETTTTRPSTFEPAATYEKGKTVNSKEKNGGLQEIKEEASGQRETGRQLLTPAEEAGVIGEKKFNSPEQRGKKRTIREGPSGINGVF